MGKTRKKEVTERNYFAKALAEKTGSFRGPHKGAKKKSEKEIIEEILAEDEGLEEEEWDDSEYDE